MSQESIDPRSVGPWDSAPTPESFFRSFMGAMAARWENPDFRGNYRSNKAWTKALLSDLTPAMAKEFGYFDMDGARAVSGEYYRIDQCWFAYKAIEPAKTWRLHVAIEHENSLDSYIYEVRKLLPVRCPLRVVIGYPRVEMHEDDPFDEGLQPRQCLAAWLPHAWPGSLDDPLALILGHRSKWSRALWRCYLLHQHEWWKAPAYEHTL